MLTFFCYAAPNPLKAALLLEETGLDHTPVLIDARRGDQISPGYLRVNPNARVPAIDDDGTAVSDSNAILPYPAEKTGMFLPKGTPELHGELLAAVIDRCPSKRCGTTDDIAELSLFLTGPQSAWRTGQIIPMDAGLVELR